MDIHRAGLIGALGLTLGATLGIPRLSVRTEAIGVRADRLALALGARRQRLPIGAQAGLLRQRLSIGTQARLTGRTRLAGRARTAIATTATTRTAIVARLERQRLTIGTEARTARTAIATTRTAAEATRAATTTGTTTARTTTGATAIATITTRSTRTATTSLATSLATTEIARRGGELPADSRARHLAATGTIVFLLLFFGRAVDEAAEALGLVAIAATAEATRATTTTAATATATISAAATTAITAAVIAIATLLLTGDAIEHVVELAARHRAVRSGLALIHAHETNRFDVAADDVERFEQARRAIRLHAENGRDVIDRGIRRLRGVGRRIARGVARRRVTVRRCIALRCRSLLGRRSLRCCRRPTVRGACLGRFAQGQGGELGERFHGWLPTTDVAPRKQKRTQEMPWIRRSPPCGPDLGPR